MRVWKSARSQVRCALTSRHVRDCPSSASRLIHGIDAPPSNLKQRYDYGMLITCIPPVFRTNYAVPVSRAPDVSTVCVLVQVDFAAVSKKVMSIPPIGQFLTYFTVREYSINSTLARFAVCLLKLLVGLAIFKTAPEARRNLSKTQGNSQKKPHFPACMKNRSSNRN